METESVISARSEPLAQRHRHHRGHRHSSNRHGSSRGAGGSEVGQPVERQRLRGPYETDPDTDRDDRSVSVRARRDIGDFNMQRNQRNDRDRDSQWGETTTVVTGATSEFNYSLEDVNVDRDLDSGLGYRCARYAGPVLIAIVGILAFLSPIAMVALPKVGIVDWPPASCKPDCEGMLIGFGFKLLILAGGSWALFVRRPRTTMPRIVVSRAVVLVLTFILVFSYWLFYGVRIYQQRHEKDNNDYASTVRFASSLVDALLFVHYLAVILVELRHLQSQYAVKVIRSPDGASRTYTVGEYSVQQLAAWCLDRYYRDFETYNPYLETVAQRGPRRMTEFKVYDVDGVSGPVTGSPGLTSLPAASSRIVAAVARQRDSGHNDRYYDEVEYERRVRRRKARLTVAADEAFAHIKRLQREPGSTKPMGSEEAAQHIFPFMARALQKYLRITRQQPKHSMASILQHLAHCISHDLSAKAFLERYLSQGIVIWNDVDYRPTQTWSIACDRVLSCCAGEGTVLELRQGDVTLLVSVRRLPHFNLVEEVLDPKANKFVLRMNSETSV